MKMFKPEPEQIAMFGHCVTWSKKNTMFERTCINARLRLFVRQRKITAGKSDAQRTSIHADTEHVLNVPVNDCAERCRLAREEGRDPAGPWDARHQHLVEEEAQPLDRFLQQQRVRVTHRAQQVPGTQHHRPATIPKQGGDTYERQAAGNTNDTRSSVGRKHPAALFGIYIFSENREIKHDKTKSLLATR